MTLDNLLIQVKNLTNTMSNLVIQLKLLFWLKW
jgi:hypothetical protein